jgi:membrane protein
MPLAARFGENGPVPGVLLRWWRFTAYVVKRFQDDGGLRTASALTYTSLLSVVPLLTVSLVILSGFGAFDDMKSQVQDTLLDFFVPQTAGQIGDYISQFLANAQKLTAPGVIGLGVTALLTLATIESTFNRIWRATKPRPWPMRLLAFWAVLTLGPLLLGISLSVSAEVQNLTDQIPIGGGLARGGRVLIQFGLQWAAFSALYLVIPAVGVRFMHALVGGAVASVLFSVLKLGFGVFVASADNYRTIYGALAAIPIFLLWLYSFWTLLLIGAHIAAALPERLLTRAEPADQTAPEIRLRMALLLLHRLWQAAGTCTALRLEDLEPEPPLDTLAQLEEAGLIARLNDGSLIAACDYARAPISTLWRALGLAIPDLEDDSKPPVLADLIAAEKDFMAKPLATLIERPPA